jgi:hypothetical protein
MRMNYSKVLTATIAATPATTSDVITVPDGMKHALINVPALATNTTVKLQVSSDIGVTYFDLHNDTGTIQGRATNTAGVISLTFTFTGVVTHLKIVIGAAQTGATSYQVSFRD